MGLRTAVAGVSRAVGWLEQTIIVTVMAFMAALLIFEVVMREIVGQGILGGIQLATYLMIWSAFLGFSYATAQGVHLRPRFADNWLPKSWAPAISRIGNALSFLILCVMGYAAIVFVQGSRDVAETAPTLGWLTWPLQLVVPIAFFLSAMRHLSYAAYPDMAPTETEMM